MRFLVVLFSVCFVLALCFGLPFLTDVRSEEGAQKFLASLKTGSIPQIVNCLGDNSCNCPPVGGFVSYIKYESGQDPNLAFLVGKTFTYGTFRILRVPTNEPYVAPWDRPESTYIDVPLKFDSYQPYFLPLDMAFGIPVSSQALADFENDPTNGAWKGFSLRLRPSLAPGFIGPPSVSYHHKPEANSPQAKYLFPKDAAGVTQANNQTIPAQNIASLLPKLESAVLRLKVVRRGSLKPWTIAKFRFLSATVTSQGKKFDLPMSPPGLPQSDL